MDLRGHQKWGPCCAAIVRREQRSASKRNWLERGRPARGETPIWQLDSGARHANAPLEIWPSKTAQVGPTVGVIRSAEFTTGSELTGIMETLKMGHAEPGMIVMCYGHLYTVVGAPFTRQHLERMP